MRRLPHRNPLAARRPPPHHWQRCGPLPLDVRTLVESNRVPSDVHLRCVVARRRGHALGSGRLSSLASGRAGGCRHPSRLRHRRNLAQPATPCGAGRRRTERAGAHPPRAADPRHLNASVDGIGHLPVVLEHVLDQLIGADRKAGRRGVPMAVLGLDKVGLGRRHQALLLGPAATPDTSASSLSVPWVQQAAYCTP